MSKISKTKEFIKDLQGRDEKTKRTYLIAASSVSMIIVILLWIAYLNLTVPPAQTAAVEATTTPTSSIDYLPQPAAAPQSSGNSFFGTLGRGLSQVYSGAASGAGSFFGQVGGFFSNLAGGFQKELHRTNTFSIEKGNETTTPTSAATATSTLQEIPPTRLP